MEHVIKKLDSFITVQQKQIDQKRKELATGALTFTEFLNFYAEDAAKAEQTRSRLNDFRRLLIKESRSEIFSSSITSLSILVRRAVIESKGVSLLGELAAANIIVEILGDILRDDPTLDEFRGQLTNLSNFF